MVQYLTESEVKRIGAMVVCKLLQCTLIDGDDSLMKVNFHPKQTCNSTYRPSTCICYITKKKRFPKMTV